MSDDELESWQRESRRYDRFVTAWQIVFVLLSIGIVLAIVIHFLKK